MSKLNVDQKSIKDLLNSKKAISLFLIISVHMRGEKRNVRLFGRTYSLLLFRKMIMRSSIQMMNTF